VSGMATFRKSPVAAMPSARGRASHRRRIVRAAHCGSGAPAAIGREGVLLVPKLQLGNTSVQKLQLRFP
jgi:hypothetical protein